MRCHVHTLTTGEMCKKFKLDYTILCELYICWRSPSMQCNSFAITNLLFSSIFNRIHSLLDCLIMHGRTLTHTHWAHELVLVFFLLCWDSLFLCLAHCSVQQFQFQFQFNQLFGFHLIIHQFLLTAFTSSIQKLLTFLFHDFKSKHLNEKICCLLMNPTNAMALSGVCLFF